MKPQSLLLAVGVFAATLATASARADTIFADKVVNYDDLETVMNGFDRPFYDPNGPVDWLPGSFDYATDGNANTWITLAKGWSITLEFTGGTVVNGEGNDLFVNESGGNDSEKADVYVSFNGLDFTKIGQSRGGTTGLFDLESIKGEYTDPVRFVKIVGLYPGDTSSGFDLSYVQGLEGSVTPAVPEPETWAMLMTGLGLLGFAYRKTVSNP